MVVTLTFATVDASEWLNIADLFLTERVREGRGERVALRLADRQLSYADVDRLANRFGHTLLGLGVRQEERVLLALPDSAEYAGALFGILKIGSFANTTELYAQRAMGWREDDITLAVPKLYFGYATGSNLLFPFSVGASAALYAEHPTAEVVFREIVRHRPTILVNVPKMVAEMVEHPGASEQNLSCLRFATSAGEALPRSLYRRWRDTFGVELYDGLGTAEMWHIFVSNQPGAVRPGSLGKAVAGFDVRIRDDDGVDLPDGEVGRLWVRGGSRALGYWHDSVRSAETFRGEWVVGGDMV